MQYLYTQDQPQIFSYEKESWFTGSVKRVENTFIFASPQNAVWNAAYSVIQT